MESIADTVVGHINIVLIGNKIIISQRIMIYEEIYDLRQHFGILYFDIFAKTGEPITVIFDTPAANVLLRLAKLFTKIET
jgi:hypothetical protein